jgi:hypothetical protein
MSLQIYIESGFAFSMKDLMAVLPSCKAIKEYDQLKSENEQLKKCASCYHTNEGVSCKHCIVKGNLDKKSS